MDNFNETNVNPVDSSLSEAKSSLAGQIITPTAETQTAHVPFWNKLPRRNLIVIAVLILITIILLIINLLPKTYSVKNTVTNVVPTPTLAPYVKSSLSLSAPKRDSSGKYLSNVEISTAQNQVTGVQIDLAFDPKVLTNVEIIPGTFFTNPIVLLKKIDTVKGVVSYTLFANTTQKSASGKGVFATLSFSILPGVKIASTQINFLPTTEVVAIGQFESVLKTTTGMTFATK